jgi:hypothetical protein
MSTPYFPLGKNLPIPLSPNFFFNILGPNEAKDRAWGSACRYVDHHRDSAYFPLRSEGSLDIHVYFDDGDVRVVGCETVYFWHRALTWLAPRGPELQEKVLRATESLDKGGRAVLVHGGLLRLFWGKNNPQGFPWGLSTSPSEVVMTSEA